MRPTDGLRAEIAALVLGVETSGVTPGEFFASTPADKIVEGLRRRAGGQPQLSTTLALMLRLDDPTLGLLLAALRDGAQQKASATSGDGEPDPAAALAESYMDNYRMGLLLEAAMSCLPNLLARMERAGTQLESDAGTREALRVLGTFTLWREEPDNPETVLLVEQLAESKSEPPSLTEDGAQVLLVAAGRGDGGKSGAPEAAEALSGRRVFEVGDPPSPAGGEE